MGSHITLTAGDGHSLGAYRAEPDGAPRGAIVVVQEIFGVNGHMRSVTDGFADHGYLAIAPALFDRVIEAGYALLDLITFFTANEVEARAWTVTSGALAPEAAGKVHTEMQRGFIRAETVAYDDYVACGGEAGARDAGKLRLEGRDYAVRDGDVLLFRFNV